MLIPNTWSCYNCTATDATKICSHLQEQITLKSILCLVTDSTVIVIQMNHA